MNPYIIIALIVAAIAVTIVVLQFLRKQKTQLQAQPADPSSPETAVTPQPTAKESLSNFLSFFVPRKDYFITPIIVNLNIAIFLAMLLSGADFFEPDNNVLIAWGANFRFLIIAGQWWRLITNVFLHAGVFHLLLNMYALVFIGLLLEPLLGRLRLSTAYLMTGIIGSLCSVYWNPVTLSVGASGAIFGLYGVFLAMLTTDCIDKEIRKSVLPSIAIFVAYNIGYGFVKSGIDNAAHIGGLTSGLAIGYLYYPGLKTEAPINRRYTTIGAAVLFFLIASVVIYKNVPDNINRYEDKMTDFGQKEHAALQFYRLPASASNEVKTSALKDGIPNWNACLKDLKEMDGLKLPQNLRAKNRELKTYCQVRLSTYRLKYKQIVENDTVRYQDSINSYNVRITTLLDSVTQKKYDQ